MQGRRSMRQTQSCCPVLRNCHSCPDLPERQRQPTRCSLAWTGGLSGLPCKGRTEWDRLDDLAAAPRPSAITTLIGQQSKPNIKARCSNSKKTKRRHVKAQMMVSIIFLAITYFSIKVCTFFRHHAIAEVTGYSSKYEHSFYIYWETKQFICLTLL